MMSGRVVGREERRGRGARESAVCKTHDFWHCFLFSAFTNKLQTSPPVPAIAPERERDAGGWDGHTDRDQHG